jgi:hypothetical protein
MCFGHIPKDLLGIITNNYGFVNTPNLEQFEANLGLLELFHEVVYAK